MCLSNETPTPDLDFENRWGRHLRQQSFTSQIWSTFDEAVSTLVQISSVINCCDLNALNPSEEEFLTKSVERHKANYAKIAELFESLNKDEIGFGLDFIDRCWDRIVEEAKNAEDNKQHDRPICRDSLEALAGIESEWTTELATIRLLITQAELNSN